MNTKNKISTLRMVFGDQLSLSLSALKDFDKSSDMVLLCEVIEEIEYVKHHQQKIIFVLSAMRHFAKELAAQGYRVKYITLDDPKNTGKLDSELQRAIADFQPKQVVITEPSEYRVKKMFEDLRDALPVPLAMLADDRFLCSHEWFAQWVKGKKQLRMEYFYREMRKKYRILLNADGSPVGGEWNYDKSNRSAMPNGTRIPSRPPLEHDELTRSVMDVVAKRFSTHFGELGQFNWVVTRAAALEQLQYFIEHLLPQFGEYQDAMQSQDAFLFHSLLSPYLNIGLLLPLEVCNAAVQAYKAKKAPLNSVEGFVRQIIGWREFIRGIYWLYMPKYEEQNFFAAHRKLPEFYWDAKTEMNCLHQVISQTKKYAYSHHIQRLMVTGNFALLAGIDPKAVCEWYLIVYADAFDWVELPNTLGMSLFGDGGVIASKPYAASGKYINKMSNFCKGCRYDPNEVTGESACPFNSLYWDFVHRNEAVLQKNNRMTYVYATWKKMADEKRTKILQQAARFLKALK